MIDFRRDDCLLHVVMTDSIGSQHEFILNCQKPIFAKLLKEELESQIAGNIHEMMEKNYSQGWDDAKSGADYRRWFPCWFETEGKTEEEPEE